MSLIYSQKIQIISLFHHLRYTRYKRLLLNTHNNLKGNSVLWTQTPN